MDLDVFRPLVDVAGPYASVTIDVTRTDRATSDDVEARWRGLAAELEQGGTPGAVLELLHEAAVAPTGRGGDWARLLVAADGRVVLDRLLPGRPMASTAAWGPVPDLMPAVRALSGLVPHAVVRVDRIGADIHVTGGPDPTDEEEETVEGDHDVLTKVAPGGMAQHRFQARVEDSWEHNAGTVAARLEDLVRRHRPEVVLLMGDVRAIAHLEEHAGRVLRERLVRLDTGGRAAGTSDEADHDAIAVALARHRADAEAALVGRFTEQRGRGEAAVEGLEPTAEALARGQAEELLLVDDPGSALRLWIGDGPTQLSIRKKEAETSGGRGDEAQQVRADAALVWAAAATGTRVSLVDPGQADPADGIGAVLRWSDASTP